MAGFIPQERGLVSVYFDRYFGVKAVVYPQR